MYLALAIKCINILVMNKEQQTMRIFILYLETAIVPIKLFVFRQFSLFKNGRIHSLNITFSVHRVIIEALSNYFIDFINLF